MSRFEFLSNAKGDQVGILKVEQKTVTPAGESLNFVTQYLNFQIRNGRLYEQQAYAGSSVGYSTAVQSTCIYDKK